MSLVAEWLTIVDAVARALLIPLALWILVSGLDDLFIDVVAFFARLPHRRNQMPSRRALLRGAQKRTAIFVPCWNESAVIGKMIRRNVEAVRYDNYELFVGAYPNDRATLDVVAELERAYPKVHIALCPHDGPTFKSDCLNWIYQRMLLFEEERGDHFEIVVTHDAEDVIHPDELHWINHYAECYDMVQVPVLPLATPVSHWTHGVYCDEFAEYHSRDMPAREFMGAFVPSSGVGTGYARAALDSLALTSSNCIFDPTCLTEDYENGIRLRLAGSAQKFITLSPDAPATRELFPQTLRQAVRQKTRWVTGIALQTWERHGWRGNWVQKYWLWRDRKGLVGSPVGLLTNFLFALEVSTSLHRGWRAPSLGSAEGCLLTATAALGIYRLLYRCCWSGIHFGYLFALATPVRVFWANYINSVATIGALYNFAEAKYRGAPLVWVKTEHQYPSAVALHPQTRRRIGEVLVGNGYVTSGQLRSALAEKPHDVRLGEFLVRRGLLDEQDLYDALSLQTCIPHSRPAPEEVRPAVARCLPAQLSREWKVVPFKVEAGTLFVACPELPTAEMEKALRPMTRLDLRFHLIPPTDYERLVSVLL